MNYNTDSTIRNTLYSNLLVNSYEKKHIDDILLSLQINNYVKAIDSLGFNCYITSVILENKNTIYALGYYEDIDGDYIAQVWYYNHEENIWYEVYDDEVSLVTMYLIKNS